MSAYVAPHKLKLHGSGSAFPGAPVTTAELLHALENMIGRGASRRARAIAHRLGIQSRYLSRDMNAARGAIVTGQDAPTLCGNALKAALAHSNDDINDLGYLIGHTTSPHTLLPPNIAWVADSLQFEAPYVELRQACTGFANALQMAGGLLNGGGLERVAIVGSETGSAYFTIDEEFATTDQLVNYVQMGDGASAVVLGPDDGSERSMISDLYIGHIGNGKAPGLSLNAGGSGQPYCPSGLPVFEHRADGVRSSGVALFEQGAATIEARGYDLRDFKRIIPHQANGKMAKPLARHLGLDQEQIHVTANRLGNLGSAAIWAAFDDLRRDDVLQPGDRVLVLGAEATKFIYGGFVYTH